MSNMSFKLDVDDPELTDKVNSIADELLEVLERNEPAPCIAMAAITAVTVHVLATHAKSKESCDVIMDQTRKTVDGSLVELQNSGLTNWQGRSH